MRQETSPRYYNLLDALPEVGCPICRLLLRDQDRYLDSLLYEYVNKVPTHQAFRRARGLCNPHMDLLQSAPGNALGIAILMRATLDEVISIDENAEPVIGSLVRLFNRNNMPPRADLLEPDGPCVLCENMNAVEASYFGVLNTHREDERLHTGLRDSPGGLCLPHIRIALRRLPDSDWLLDIQREHWRYLFDQINMFTEKYNHSLRLESFGDEGDSWRRVIRYLAGEPGVFGLRRTNQK